MEGKKSKELEKFGGRKRKI